MANIEKQIQERVHQFAAELAELIQEAVTDSVASALSTSSTLSVRRGPGRPKGSTNAAAPAKKKRGRKPGRPKGSGKKTAKKAAKKTAKKVGKVGRPRKAKGQKRSQEEIARMESRLLAEIKREPGRRIEQLGKSLNIDTKELFLPIKKLLKDRKISKKGNRRATTYSALAAAA